MIVVKKSKLLCIWVQIIYTDGQRFDGQYLPYIEFKWLSEKKN